MLFDPVYPKLSSLQHAINTKFNEILYLLFVMLSLWNLVCVLHFQDISIWISDISSAQEPNVAGGCHVGQCCSKVNTPTSVIFQT